MKLSVMREFIQLAANHNYSKTAEELYIAQSALSRHILSLEDELNTKLIDRSRNSFELTRTGEIVLEEFDKILKDYELMLDKISRQTKIEQGELHLGFLYYDMNYYVAKIRDVFHKKHPQIQLVLHSYQPMQLETDLLDGKIDVAIIYGIGGCQHKDHRLASLNHFCISDLNGEKLLYPEKPFILNHVEKALKEILKNGGVHDYDRVQIHNYDEVPWLMQENNAVYISPMVNNQAYGNNTKYQFLLPEQYHTDVSAVWLSDNNNDAIKLLRSTIKTCYP